MYIYIYIYIYYLYRGMSSLRHTYETPDDFLASSMLASDVKRRGKKEGKKEHSKRIYSDVPWSKSRENVRKKRNCERV